MDSFKPKLRFPEFKDDWNLYSLRDFIVKIESGWSPVCLAENVKEGEWGSLKTTSISWEGYFPNENKKLPTNLEPRKNTEVVIDDILITRVGPFDRVGVVVHVNKPWKHLMVSDNMFRLKLRGEIFAPFVPLILGSSNVQALWKQKIAGLAAAQVVINQQTIFSTELILPSLEEQTRIANFLSSVDEKLNLLKEKKALLEEYKKGVMQKIFNQEIRFKDDNGNDFEDWEEKTIGEVCKLQGGYAFKSNLFKTSGIPIIRISNISNNNNHIELNNIVFYDKIENDNNFLVKNGDLLIAMSGATTGKSSVYNLNYNSYLNQRVGLFKSKIKELYYPYLIQFVFSIEFEKQLDSVLVAGAQPNISSSSIENFNLPLPCLKEQTKIANFLSAIDEKIELVSNQIKDTHEYKKGLLQQMFV